MLYIIVFHPQLHVYGLYTLCVIPSAVGRDYKYMYVWVGVCAFTLCNLLRKVKRKTMATKLEFIKIQKAGSETKRDFWGGCLQITSRRHWLESVGHFRFSPWGVQAGTRQSFNRSDRYRKMWSQEGNANRWGWVRFFPWPEAWIPLRWQGGMQFQIPPMRFESCTLCIQICKSWTWSSTRILPSLCKKKKRWRSGRRKKKKKKIYVVFLFYS